MVRKCWERTTWEYQAQAPKNAFTICLCPSTHSLLQVQVQLRTLTALWHSRPKPGNWDSRPVTKVDGKLASRWMHRDAIAHLDDSGLVVMMINFGFSVPRKAITQDGGSQKPGVFSFCWIADRQCSLLSLCWYHLVSSYGARDRNGVFTRTKGARLVSESLSLWYLIVHF